MFLNMVLTPGRFEFCLYRSHQNNAHQCGTCWWVGWCRLRAKGMQGREPLGTRVAQEGSWNRCRFFHSFIHSFT